VNCSSSFAIGANGPGSARMVSCVDLYPAGQCFAADAGVTLRFKWTQEAGPGCTVSGTAVIPEGQLRVFDDGFTPATAECGSLSVDPVCPPETALVYSGCGGSAGANCPDPFGSFCSSAVCMPDDAPGVFEVSDVRHFSRHGLGVVCYDINDTRKVKITKLSKPLGSQGFSFSGDLARWTAQPPDPVAEGIAIRLYDAAGTILDAVVAPGAAWTPNGSGTKWTYRSPANTGLTKVVIKDRSSLQPGMVRFKVKGQGLSLAPASAYVEGQILFPSYGDCYRAAFPGEPGPACSQSGATLRCK
jgi:hypothetical protein